MGVLRLTLLLIAERIVRLPMHARLRPTLLRMLGANIGRGCRIDEVRFINLNGRGFANLTVGDDSYIGSGTIVDLIGAVAIGASVGIAPGCIIMTHFDPSGVPGNALASVYEQRITSVEIGDHVVIGANATLLEGVSVGASTMIGAGATVTKSLPSGVLACGTPCAVKRSVSPVAVA